MSKDKVIVTGDAVNEENTAGVPDNSTPAPEVVAPSEAKNEAKKLVGATNSDVEKAGNEAATRLEGQRREAFNVTDATLATDEHYKNVRRAQAATAGEDYDPKTDPELTSGGARGTITPAPSQNQNNLIHPNDDVIAHPHGSRNYLGQKI